MYVMRHRGWQDVRNPDRRPTAAPGSVWAAPPPPKDAEPTMIGQAGARIQPGEVGVGAVPCARDTPRRGSQRCARCSHTKGGSHEEVSPQTHGDTSRLTAATTASRYNGGHRLRPGTHQVGVFVPVGGTGAAAAQYTGRAHTFAGAGAGVPGAGLWGRSGVRGLWLRLRDRLVARAATGGGGGGRPQHDGESAGRRSRPMGWMPAAWR
jgi:hypothetical protein